MGFAGKLDHKASAEQKVFPPLCGTLRLLLRVLVILWSFLEDGCIGQAEKDLVF